MQDVEPVRLPAPRGRPAKRPRKSGGRKPQEFRLDKESKNRIRRIPELTKFYRFVKQFHLRDEAYRTLVFHALGIEAERRIRRLMAAGPKLTA